MNYLCPICQQELTEYMGEAVHPGDSEYGVTLDCGNKECMAQEVSGHGRNAKEAYGIVQDKFMKREDRDSAPKKSKKNN